LSMHRNPTRMPSKDKNKGLDDGNFADSQDSTYDIKTILEVTASRFSPGGRSLLYWQGDTMSFETADYEAEKKTNDTESQNTEVASGAQQEMFPRGDGDAT